MSFLPRLEFAGKEEDDESMDVGIGSSVRREYVCSSTCTDIHRVPFDIFMCTVESGEIPKRGSSLDVNEGNENKKAESERERGRAKEKQDGSCSIGGVFHTYFHRVPMLFPPPVVLLPRAEPSMPADIKTAVGQINAVSSDDVWASTANVYSDRSVDMVERTNYARAPNFSPFFLILLQKLGHSHRGPSIRPATLTLPPPSPSFPHASDQFLLAFLSENKI